MPVPPIEEFGKLLVQQVRDQAIRACDQEVSATSRSPVAVRWREAMGDRVDPEVLRTVIPDCVDETVFWLLQAIDQGVLRLSYTDAAGNQVDLAEAGLGELAGWYSGSWRFTHSEERSVDDFGDLGPP
jgi:hypothetical protein